MIFDGRVIPSYSEKFLKCIPVVLGLEGHFSDHPADRGGKTYWGICEKYHPKEVAIMSEMSEQESKEYATDWYYRNYWIKLNLEQFDTKLALIIFNLSEAMGIYKEMAWITNIPKEATLEWILLKAVSVRAKRCNDDASQKVFLLGWINGILALWNYDGN